MSQLRNVEARFKKLLATWEEGHLLREGARVVIAGKPNVGKSTLMNALVGKDRSIVTPIAGTTRDVIEEQVVINGYMVRLLDTAGLRESECEIETEGVRRAKNQIEKADVIIYVVDGSCDLDDHDRIQIDRLSDRTSIIAINKSDIETKETNQPLATKRSTTRISAMTLQGVDELKRLILEKLGLTHGSEHHAVISERHRKLLISAHKDVVEATLLISRPSPEPALAASRLRGALETLGEATGRVYHDELLNNIFSRFCIGK